MQKSNCLRILVLTVLGLIMLVGVPSWSAVEIIAGPYLQSPTESSMTVMWMTDVNSTGLVEYGSREDLSYKAISSHDGLIDANERIHQVTIYGLKPGGTYSYRAVSQEIIIFEPYKVTYGETAKSVVYDFTTLDQGKKNITFIVLNDVHENVENMKDRLARAGSQPYDLVFLNGDILSHLETEEQIVNKLLKPCSEIFASRIPFCFVRGNHEARGKYARQLKNYLGSADQKYYYSFDHGPIHFVVLDSGEDKEDSHWAYSGLNDFDRYRDQERQWLVSEIESAAFKSAKFRVVLTHIPLFGSGQGHGTLDCREKWAPLLNKGKVDLHISGHTHRYAVLESVPGEHDYPIIIGGGPQKEGGTFIRVEATENELAVTMTRDDGEIVGSFKVKARR
ncbi:MAG: metallophosphoesterase family protein [Sedimentisphaerales bacterium]|nr:metallophosphoesterase family protein [Sedimentisphaerales bacterium]